jgi:hypothetical protein
MAIADRFAERVVIRQGRRQPVKSRINYVY